MKLYFAPRTRATRPRWLLEELGVPYELVRLDLAKGEHRTPEFLGLNPLGEVPVLVDGAAILSEPAAICLYLADRYPEKLLAPAARSPERAAFLQWLLFAERTLEPVVLELRANALLPPEQRADLSKQHARIEELLAVVDGQLEDRECVAGNSFTAADLVLAAILHLAHTLRLLETRPRLLAYVLRHTARPATRRALS